MDQYHKIQTVFLRDPATNYKTLLEGQFALPEFEYLQYNKWVFTEKVDGTNIRVMFNGTMVMFGGKTDNAQIPTNLLLALQNQFMPVKAMRLLAAQFPDAAEVPVCLYGEGYGARIQKGGGNYRSDQGFVLFDVKIGEWWLGRTDVEEIATALGLDVVPILMVGTLHDMVEMVRTGFTSTWGDFLAEGLVGKPAVELNRRSGARIVTKLKCKDFQLRG